MVGDSRESLWALWYAIIFNEFSFFLLEMFAIIYTSIYFHPIHFILKFPRNSLCMWVIKALG